MAIGRGRVPLTLANRDTGLPIAGASVRINIRSSGSPATLYSGETGTGVVSNPATTDSSGRVSAWLNRGQYVAVISGTGISNAAPEAFDISPGGDGNVDTAWIETNGVTLPKMADASVGTAELANNAVTLGKLATNVGGRIILSGNAIGWSIGSNGTTFIGAPWTVTHNGKQCFAFLITGTNNIGFGAIAYMGWRHFMDDVQGSFIGQSIAVNPGDVVSHSAVLDLGVLSGSHKHNIRVENGNTASGSRNLANSLFILWEAY